MAPAQDERRKPQSEPFRGLTFDSAIIPLRDEIFERTTRPAAEPTPRRAPPQFRPSADPKTEIRKQPPRRTAPSRTSRLERGTPGGRAPLLLYFPAYEPARVPEEGESAGAGFSSGAFSAGVSAGGFAVCVSAGVVATCTTYAGGVPAVSPTASAGVVVPIGETGAGVDSPAAMLSAAASSSLT